MHNCHYGEKRYCDNSEWLQGDTPQVEVSASMCRRDIQEGLRFKGLDCFRSNMGDKKRHRQYSNVFAGAAPSMSTC